MRTNPNPVSETDLQARMQRIQDNLQMMHTYFDALFGKDLNPILEMIDDNIEWLVVPTGDTLKGKEQIAKLAPNHWAASPNRIKNLVNLFASEEFACLEYRTAGTLTNQASTGNRGQHPCAPSLMGCRLRPLSSSRELLVHCSLGGGEGDSHVADRTALRSKATRAK